MKQILAVILLCLANGSVANASERLKAAGNEYSRCVMEQAIRFAKQKGDVFSLAAAAEGGCRGNLLRFSDEAARENPRMGRQLAAAVQDDTIREAASLIAEIRASRTQ